MASYFENMARTFLGQGVAFGFGDEIEAYMRSLGGDKRPYEAIVAEVRRDLERFRERNPVASIGAELAGAAFTGLGGLARLGVRGAATGAQAVARSAAVGTAEGGLFGMGIADPDRTTDVSEALIERAGSAILGAGAGAILGGVGGAIGSKLAKNAVRNEAVRIAEELAETSGKKMSKEEVDFLSNTLEKATTEAQQQAEQNFLGLAEGVKDVNIKTMHQVFDEGFFGAMDAAGGDPVKMKQLLEMAAERYGAVITKSTGRANEAGAKTDVMVDLAKRNILRMGTSPERVEQLLKHATVEEAVAASDIMTSSLLRLQKLSDDLLSAPEGSAERIELSKLFAIHWLNTGKIINDVLGFQAEIGRTMRRMQRQFIDPTAALTPKELNKLMKENLGKSPEELARLVQNQTREDTGGFVANMIRNPDLAKDAAFELWLNGLLSGPRTQIVNVASNAINSFIVSPAETLIAAGADAANVALQRLAGKDAKRSVFFKEAAVELGAAVKSIKSGLIAGRNAFKTEQSAFRGTKIDAPFGAIPGKTGKVVRIPGRMLLAGDDFFKTINYSSKLHSLAYKEARRGLPRNATAQEIANVAEELIQNPTSSMIKKARDQAAKLTFTNDLGRLGGLIQGIRGESLLARVALPFFKTPANIVKFAGVRSPLAPFAKSVREELKRGGEARAHALARMSLGTGIGLAVMEMAVSGDITGGGPQDPSKRAVWWASGRQPYSVKIGDTYYSYGRLEPFGMLMGVAADLVELQNTVSDEEIENIAGLMFGSIATNLVSKTWLRGPTDLMQAIMDPERYGDRYVRNLGGTVVPNFINQVSQAIDPNLRESRSMMDAIIARTPLRSSLQSRRDIFGNEIQLSGGFASLVSPVFTSEFANSPAAEAMLDAGVGVSKVPNTISGIELTPEQLDRFRVLSGQFTEQALNDVIAKPGFDTLPIDDKRVVLRSVMRRARDRAKTQLKQEDQQLSVDIANRGGEQDRQRLLRREFR